MAIPPTFYSYWQVDCVIYCTSLICFVSLKTDDLGYGDIRVYPNPNSPHGRLSTPSLDKLAQESLMFTDAYAGAPVCAPSRCALVGVRIITQHTSPKHSL